MRTKLAISVCVSAALLLAGCGGADSVEGAAQAGGERSGFVTDHDDVVRA